MKLTEYGIWVISDAPYRGPTVWNTPFEDAIPVGIFTVIVKHELPIIYLNRTGTKGYLEMANAGYRSTFYKYFWRGRTFKEVVLHGCERWATSIGRKREIIKLIKEV